MVRGRSTVKPFQGCLEFKVTSGPGPVRKLFHLELNDPTVRRKLNEFLGKRSPAWFAAQNTRNPFLKLEKAWTELLEELRSDCNLGVTWLATLDSQLFGADQYDMPPEVQLDHGVFRRMYFDYVLGFPCADLCGQTRSVMAPDPCGDALGQLIKWRFNDGVGVEGSSDPEPTWRCLRGVNLRAFLLLCRMYTVVFLADMVDSRVGQERVSLVLGICRDRLLHLVNTGVDDVSRNTKSVYMVSCPKGVKLGHSKRSAWKQ